MRHQVSCAGTQQQNTARFKYQSRPDGDRPHKFLTALTSADIIAILIQIIRFAGQDNALRAAVLQPRLRPSTECQSEPERLRNEPMKDGR